MCLGLSMTVIFPPQACSGVLHLGSWPQPSDALSAEFSPLLLSTAVNELPTPKLRAYNRWKHVLLLPYHCRETASSGK